MSFVSDYADMLTSTVTIQSEINTTDAGGGSVKTWSTRQANIPASIQPVRLDGRKLESGEKLEADVTNTVYLGPATTVVNGDRIICGSTKYQVEYVADQGGLGEVFVAYVIKVDE